ncbi:hypothetical protein D6856_14690 [Butyrivibrio sp. XB500-5]|uniref:hypothetical protein n=1 Tax=Butyrivibrio sp. XB500-5 TaxID=2364880 RepID=UPI000EAA9990|nr:hypothetical protein [Butyrivibrio sp. XB500-5]RKM56741.1 hypothetical protein D6856_14690 [Butyrivibrio sp. XB500-5]
MDEIFGIKRDSYDMYEELLLKRDQLEREASSIRISYMKEFGDLITEDYNLKIECIKKKKTIAYCQQSINKGQVLDMQVIDASITEDMKIYYAELEQLSHDFELAKNSKTSSASNAERAKKIYRRIAKRIHPDIYHQTMEHEELKDLWERTFSAYHMLDPDELADIEVLINKYLKGLGEDSFEIDIPDIDKRIEKLEAEISEIMRTEPYIYKEILDDENAVSEKKNEFKAEIEEYKRYLEELSGVLNDLLTEGGATFIWKMD